MRLSDSAAIEMRPTSSVRRNWPSPRSGIADEVVVGHPHVVEVQLAGVEAPPADAPHLRAHREAGRVLLHDERGVVARSVRASSVTPKDMSVPAFEMNVLRPLISQPPSRALGPRADAAGVGAGVGLGEAEGAERPALGQRAQPALPLLRRCRTGAAAASRSSRGPARPRATDWSARPICSMAATKPDRRHADAAPLLGDEHPEQAELRPSPAAGRWGSAPRPTPAAPASRSPSARSRGRARRGRARPR